MNLDRWFPAAGPCGLCGGPDKRHRLGDMLYSRWRAGDSIDSLVRDYDWLSHTAIIANNVAYELSRRAHRRRPFQGLPPAAPEEPR